MALDNATSSQKPPWATLPADHDELPNAPPSLTPRDGRLDAAVEAGFRFDSKGTHTSRTIMFEELPAFSK